MNAPTARILASLIVLAALPLSGCIGGESNAATEPVSTGEAPIPPAAADATAGAAENATADVEAPPAPVSVNVTYDGETGTFVCAFVVVTGQCQGQFSSTAMQQLQHQGTPLRLTGTVTWTTSSPTASEMQVAIIIKNGSAFEWREDLPNARGASPLSFDFDLSAIQGLDIYVDVNSVKGQMVPGVLGAGGSVKQPFHLESVFTYQPPS